LRRCSAKLQAIADAAWDAYDDGRKAPITRKAGAGFADPDYEIAIDWLTARDAIDDARRRHDDPAGASRILVVNGSSRTEHNCPGEMSKMHLVLAGSKSEVDGYIGYFEPYATGHEALDRDVAFRWRPSAPDD
jgi:hypothetical protein